MDKFRDAYREASEELPQISISAEEVRSVQLHDRIQRRRRRVMIARGCAAAAVFLLCGVGTVAARNYRESIISMRENGFVITGSGEGAGASGKVLPLADEMDKILEIAPNLKIGGVFSIEGLIPDREMKSIEIEEREYDSLEAFLAAEDTAIVIPEKGLFSEEFTSERVCVIGEGEDIYMYFMNEDSYFSLHQMDNRQYASYSLATSYMGQSSNERSFTNSQGLNYTVFDIVDETGALQSVHAVISVNGWDLAVSFGGFEQSEMERVLNSLDLTVYFEDER
nr:hypothetical protein [uncultured Acetatifactor sp.]